MSDAWDVKQTTTYHIHIIALYLIMFKRNTRSGMIQTATSPPGTVTCAIQKTENCHVPHKGVFRLVDMKSFTKYRGQKVANNPLVSGHLNSSFRIDPVSIQLKKLQFLNQSLLFSQQY